MRGAHSAELHNVRSAVISRIDNFNRKLGHAIAWLALALVLVQFTVVVLRYVFSIGFAPMQEAVWHLHGLLFMLGAGYTLLRDEHVRVDVLYREASPKQKAITDFGGCLLFVIPVCGLTFYTSWDYVLNAIYDFQNGNWILESSPEFGGLPLIWAYKLIIWIFAAVVFVQGLSTAAKALAFLRGSANIYPPLENPSGRQF